MEKIFNRKAAIPLTVFWVCILASSTVLAFALDAQAVNASNDTAVAETEVKETLDNNEFARVIVILKEGRSPAEKNNEAQNSRDKFINKLKEKADKTAAPVKVELQKELDNGNIKNLYFYWVVNAFSAQVNEEALDTIISLPQVERVVKDRAHTLQTSAKPPASKPGENPVSQKQSIPWNLELINARRVWENGIHGNDIVVAIMDTGVDPTHPALKNSYRGNQEGHDHNTSWFDVTSGFDENGRKEPADPNGHGTHVAGIILGGTPYAPQGVAPGAQWMAVNIFSEGYAWDSQIIKAFQWLLAPDNDPENAPDIINCSWASRPDYKADPLQWELLQNLEQAGVFVVFAAGNNGLDGPGTPASFPHAFSVGALKQDEEGTVSIARFSSRGYVDWNGIKYPKPEISAPGTNIVSAWPGGAHHTLDGTSMAAAHVSGTAALLLEAKPELKPYQIGNILKDTAQWKNDKGPDANYGYGTVDAYRAIRNISAPEEDVLFEDGANNKLNNWDTSPDSPWDVTDEKTYDGNYAYTNSPSDKYPSDTESWLSISEPILLCGYYIPVLSFNHFHDLSEGEKNEEKDYAYVEVSPDNENWVRLYRFSGTNEEFQKFSLPLHLPPEEKELYLRFKMENNNSGQGKGWYIDNIRVTAAPLPLDKLDGFKIKTPEKVIGVNEMLELEVEALFCSEVKRTIEPNRIYWSSSDEDLAVVDRGRVKGVSPGEVTIRGRFAGKTAEVEMEVIQVAAPDASHATGIYYHSVEVELMPPKPGIEIRYTLDGSNPNRESSLYEEPLKIKDTTILKARSYDNGVPGPVRMFPYRINEGGKVTGQIELQGRDLVDEKTMAYFICQEDNKKRHVCPDQNDGTFSKGLPPGRYLLVIEREKYLTRIKEVTIEKDDIIELPLVELLAGDITGSNKVEFSDLLLLSEAFNSTPGDENWNPLADLNGDGVINSKDLELLRNNYAREGDKL